MRNIFALDRATNIFFANRGAAEFYAKQNDISPDEQDLIDVEVIWYVTINNNAKVIAIFPPLSTTPKVPYSWRRNPPDKEPFVVTEHMVNVINNSYLTGRAKTHSKGKGYWRS